MVSAIDWTQPAVAIAEQVNAAKTSESPCFSYLKGCMLLCKGAIAESEAHEWGAVQPGSLLQVDQDGTLVVGAGGGSAVRLTKHHMTFYNGETSDFVEFLRVFRIKLPQQLSSVPFLRNRDSSVWERGVRMWGKRVTSADEGATSPAAQGVLGIAGILPHNRTALTEPNLPYFDNLFDDLGIVAASRCLDIGCDDGWAMWVFAKLGMQVAGFDISPAGFATARDGLPGVQLAELDYFDAGTFYEMQDLTFDFILCRSLGVAQKIVDWTDPEWREATSRLLGRLSPDGVVYWCHHTDRRGQLTLEGFTHPTAATLLSFFRSIGLEALDVSAYGANLLLQLVRDGFSPARAARYRRRRALRRQLALHRFRAASMTSNQQVAWDAFREATAHVATLLAGPGVHDQQRLIIVGTDPIAATYEAAARVLYMPVIAHWSSDNAAFVTNRPIHAPGWFPENLSEYPTAIVVADPMLEDVARAAAGSVTPPIPVLSPWLRLPGSTDDRLGESYLLSGDQDRNLHPIVQTLFPWPPRPPSPASSEAVSRVHTGSVDSEDWRVVGSGRAMKSIDEYRFTALGEELMYLERTSETPYRLTGSLTCHSGGPNDCGLEIAGDVIWRLTIDAHGAMLSRHDQQEPVAFAPLLTDTPVAFEVDARDDSLRFSVQGIELHSTAPFSDPTQRIRIGIIEKSGADTEMGCVDLRFTPDIHRPIIRAKAAMTATPRRPSGTIKQKARSRALKT